MKATRKPRQPMTVHVVGKRFSRVEVTTAYTERDRHLLIKQMSQNEDMDFEAHVARVKEECAEILRGSGLPSALHVFRSKITPDTWTVDKPAPGQTLRVMLIDLHVIERGFAVDSSEHLAARILVEAARMETASLGGHLDNALEHAFAFGHLATLLDTYDIDYIGHAKGGDKGTQARSAKAKIRLAKLQAEEEKLKKDEPSIKKEVVAATLADRGFGGKGAIAKLLRGHSRKSLETK